MARIPYPDPASLAPDIKATVEKLGPLNVFRMMAGGGGLLSAFTQMGTYLLFKTKLDPILREIAIIRVGVLSKASYEVFQHERIGRGLGMSDPLIAAIHEGPDAEAFTALQRLVMLYTDDVVRNVRAADSTFKPLQQNLPVQELQELTVTIGYYMMVSRFLETFDVDIETKG